MGREAELAELAAFCLEPGRGPYVWWRAGAWAGKSALLSTFVLHPPPEVGGRVRMVSFFITARLAAQDTREAFTQVLLEQLAELTGQLGSYGTRGVGYDVEYLVYQVSRELGLTQDWPLIIVGAGNLGRALVNYGGFASRGFRIAAVLDSDPEVVGTQIAGHRVLDVAQIEQVVARHRVSIGVIATPAGTAQAVCDRLVAAGATSILNFAPVVLNVPSGVDVRKVDLSIELQILAFHAQRTSVVRVYRGLVLGGTSILGGRGSYLGTIAGAVLLVTMTALITVINASEGWRSLILGPDPRHATVVGPRPVALKKEHNRCMCKTSTPLARW